MNFPASVLTKKQKKFFGPKPIDYYRKGAVITACVRYDDECGNGHNTFSITADVYVPGARDIEAGGCMHEEIAKKFPELSPLIKWHLCSSDGPMHYLANTIYHAGDRDHNGLRKGEFRQMIDRATGLPLWKLDIEYSDLHATFASEEQPPDNVIKYVPYGITGEGKERQLDYARNSAIWPEATDEELMAPNLAELLEARLPKLMEEFKAAVESLGFIY